MLRIGFFGTPHLSARVLRNFIDSPDMEVAFVVTGEDKPVGRHQVITPNEVKRLALEYNIPVLQPSKVRGNTEFFEMIQTFDADYFVVVAYGKILPPELLHIPRKYQGSPEKGGNSSEKRVLEGTVRSSTANEDTELGAGSSRFAEIPCLNIHGSILPKYRGASPIQAALIAGESETGVTIMEMDEKMDEGNIVDILKIQIDPSETTLTLFEKFARVSGAFAIDTIKRLDDGILKPTPQDHSKATYCSKISKEDGRLDFSKSAKELYHMWQGFTPWPGVFTEYEGKRLVIEECSHVSLPSPHPNPLPEGEGSSLLSPLPLGEELGVRAEDIPVGTVIRLADKSIGVVCRKGILTLSRVKLEGKKSQSIGEFINGHQDFISSILL